MPEITRHCPEAAWLLVGTKCDLRNDPQTLASLAQRGLTPVPKEAAEALAAELGAAAYCENSALTQEGLKCVSSVPVLCRLLTRRAGKRSTRASAPLLGGGAPRSPRCRPLPPALPWRLLEAHCARVCRRQVCFPSLVPEVRRHFLCV